MIQKIIDAIIENGQIKDVEENLPKGKIRVRLIYEQEEKPPDGNDIMRLLKETSGIYKEIDAESESKTLRDSWERDNKK